MRISDLQAKDIISTSDGKKIGKIVDIEIDDNEGKILYFIVEPKQLIRGIIGGNKESMVSFNNIKKIGEDVILVDL